ncbi:unnamed protein product [Hymenolepis diminuta]|uniref:Senescence domain-containing protein n=1 Tax=Hymenolepis diminuta TaxID=6216 RepID=A0A0R3SP87_HYMDI|nr:unnamed protein product [Hymenolepis diminuta]
MRQNSLVNEYRSQYAFNPLLFYSLSVHPRHQTKVSGSYSIYRVEFFVFPCHVNPKIISATAGRLKAVGSAIGNAVVGGAKAVVSGAKAVGSAIKNAVVGGAKAVVSGAKAVGRGLKAVGSAIKNAVVNEAKAVGRGVKAVGSAIKKAVVNEAKATYGFFKKLFKRNHDDLDFEKNYKYVPPEECQG